MKGLQGISQRQMLLFLLVPCCVLFTLSGCSLMEVHKQTQATENVGYIKGNIKVSSDQKGPIMVLRFRDEKGLPLILESERSTSSEGDFLFPVIPGTFFIAAFIDVNKDRVYQSEEHGNYYGIPSKIDVTSKQTVTLDTITISGPVPKLETNIKTIARFSAAWTNIGQVVSLNDPRFNRNNYSMGLWKPLDFLTIAEGGVFFLEEYQKDKVPVLFIHGVLDGPTLWSEVIEILDKQNFQPWVAYYPSGLRLDMVSDYLTEAVSRLQNKHGFKEFIIIAHSMGGLVTRSFVKKYVERAPGNSKNCDW